MAEAYEVVRGTRVGTSSPGAYVTGIRDVNDRLIRRIADEEFAALHTIGL